MVLPIQTVHLFHFLYIYSCQAHVSVILTIKSIVNIFAVSKETRKCGLKTFCFIDQNVAVNDTDNYVLIRRKLHVHVTARREGFIIIS